MHDGGGTDAARGSGRAMKTQRLRACGRRRRHNPEPHVATQRQAERRGCATAEHTAEHTAGGARVWTPRSRVYVTKNVRRVCQQQTKLSHASLSNRTLRLRICARARCVRYWRCLPVCWGLGVCGGSRLPAFLRVSQQATAQSALVAQQKMRCSTTAVTHAVALGPVARPVLMYALVARLGCVA